MRAFTTLPVLALAASVVSPVLSIPVPDNQAQARAELEGRALPIGQFLKFIAKQVGIGAALSAVESVFTSGSTSSSSQSGRSFEPYYARDFSEEERRDIKSLGFNKLFKTNKSFQDYILGGIASAIGFDAFDSFVSHSHNSSLKRTPEPGLFGDFLDKVGKLIVGTAASYTANQYFGSHGLPRSDASPADVLAALEILDRRDVPDELVVALHNILSRAVNELD